MPAGITQGVSQLQFEKLLPVRLEMPGVRGLISKETTVRVSMVLTRDTGYPTSLSAMDQRTGRRRSYSRAQLSKSSGAWLGDSDTVFVPLMHEGEYAVVLRLRGRGVSVPLGLGKVKVAFVPGVQPVARVAVDPKKLQGALAKMTAQLAEAARKAAAAAKSPSKPARRGRGRR